MFLQEEELLEVGDLLKEGEDRQWGTDDRGRYCLLLPGAQKILRAHKLHLGDVAVTWIGVPPFPSVKVNLLDDDGVLCGSGVGACGTGEGFLWKFENNQRVPKPRIANMMVQTAMSFALINATIQSLGLSEFFTQGLTKAEMANHSNVPVDTVPAGNGQPAASAPGGEAKAAPVTGTETVPVEEAPKIAPKETEKPAEESEETPKSAEGTQTEQKTASTTPEEEKTAGKPIPVRSLNYIRRVEKDAVQGPIFTKWLKDKKIEMKDLVASEDLYKELLAHLKATLKVG